jgi:hypothetical protein
MAALVSKPSTRVFPFAPSIVQQACPEVCSCLTDMERVHLAAGLGLLLFRTREIHPDLAALLRSLSGADARV